MNKMLNDAYIDRNLAVQAIGKFALQAGYNVWIKKDVENDGFSILYIDLPTGQVSWHIPDGEIVTNFPDYDGSWDLHDTKQKRERLAEFIKRNGI